MVRGRVRVRISVSVCELAAESRSPRANTTASSIKSIISPPDCHQILLAVRGYLFMVSVIYGTVRFSFSHYGARLILD